MISHPARTHTRNVARSLMSGALVAARARHGTDSTALAAPHASGLSVPAGRRRLAGPAVRLLLLAVSSWQLDRVSVSSVRQGCRRSTELVLQIAACTRSCR